MSQVHDDREALLSRAFVDLADTLVGDYDVVEVLDRLVGYSVALLSADAAGIMLVDPRGQLRVVASSEEADWTELMQIQADRARPSASGLMPSSVMNVAIPNLIVLSYPIGPAPKGALGG